MHNNARSKPFRRWSLLIITVMLLIGTFNLPAFSDAKEMAKTAQNPIANMISLPIQNNTNFYYGDYDRAQNVLNIQPVIPIPIKDKVNLINRVIIPLVWQPDFTTASEGTFGLGDINYTVFVSPLIPSCPVTWGVGPVVVFPSATDEVLGQGKWSLGPSAVLLGMPANWVVGVLVNNVWSVGGYSDREDVNQMLLQYFINYNFKYGIYLTTAPIITANWKATENNQWVVPVGAGIGKVTIVGKLPINVSVQGYYNVVTPDNGPAWQLRAQLQFLFPTGKKPEKNTKDTARAQILQANLNTEEKIDGF
jgi:hypothetical protein